MSTACPIDPMSAQQRDAWEAEVLRHLPQVRSIAHHIRSRLPQHVELADLIGTGTLGLIDAIRKFDPARDAAFATYAQIRIRGAILDWLRSTDGGSRRLRSLARRIDVARDHLSGILGRLPLPAELAQHLEISERDMENSLAEVRALQPATSAADQDESHASLIDGIPALDPDPLEELLHSERIRRLLYSVEALPAKERELLRLYYGEELTMKEIGARFGVSESRISQLHAGALYAVKRQLRPKDR